MSDNPTRAGREEMSAAAVAMLLPEALEEAARGPAGRELDGGQRLQVLDTLIAALEGSYAHLPPSGRPTPPIRCRPSPCSAAARSNWAKAEFHRAVTSIVTGLRDAHTRYIGPLPLRDSVAVLPFLVEQYGPDARPALSGQQGERRDREEISWVRARNCRAAGCELESSWNGVPFARAVEIHADAETGGRPDSRRARALESLTSEPWSTGRRRMSTGSSWATAPRGAEAAEVKLPWRVLSPGKARTAMDERSLAAGKMAADLSGEADRRAKKLMFATELWAG